MNSSANHRVLVIDDNPSIHEDFRKILGDRHHTGDSLEAREALLFGARRETTPLPEFEVDSAYQGEEGLERIVSACREDHPFAVAFVDVRMPPGWDGVETIERIWAADPDIQLVICSAYSDYSAGNILQRLGVSDRLLMLRKPCDTAEILLIASTLCQKWSLAEAARSVQDMCESSKVAT